MIKKLKPSRAPKPNRSIRLGAEHLEDRCVPATLQVGTLAGDLTFAQAAAAAQDGDTVQVQAGMYTNIDVKWNANNLTIQAVGGQAVIDDSGYSISNQKGIFDIIGDDATVQGITFENAHDFGDAGHNFAGIRDEGSGLILNGDSFLNNDDGILVTPSSSGVGDVLVEFSVFSNNGYGDGQSHNMYIGHVDSFVLAYSSTTDANVGHDVKSRAANTYLLYNFIGDSGAGANDQASLVDLPDGGSSYLIGNVLHKGSGSSNGTMIDSNVEGYADSTQENPTQLLELVNNTVVNDRGAGTYVLVAGPQAAPVNLINNVFAGLGEGNTALDSGQNGAPAAPATNQTNLMAVDPGFVNAAGLNYQLASGSAAIDAGTDPGMINGLDLTPTDDYVAVANTEARPVQGPLDIGAYEFAAPAPPPAPAGGPQDLSASFDLPGVVADGQAFSGGLDGFGFAYSADLLGPTVAAGGATFTLGAPGGDDAIAAAGQTVALAQGSFSALSFLGTAVDGNQAAQAFTVDYTDGTSQTYTQGLSDWYTPQSYAGEAIAATTAYRDTASGGRQALAMNLYAYSFALDPSKVVSGITLPDDADVEVLAIDLS